MLTAQTVKYYKPNKPESTWLDSAAADTSSHTDSLPLTLSVHDRSCGNTCLIDSLQLRDWLLFMCQGWTVVSVPRWYTSFSAWLWSLFCIVIKTSMNIYDVPELAKSPLSSGVSYKKKASLIILWDLIPSQYLQFSDSFTVFHCLSINTFRGFRKDHTFTVSNTHRTNVHSQSGLWIGNLTVKSLQSAPFIHPLIFHTK